LPNGKKCGIKSLIKILLPHVSLLSLIVTAIKGAVCSGWRDCLSFWWHILLDE